jgi:hypothetical protein
MENKKNVWLLIKKYFPDVWQYLIILIIMILAVFFIL